MPTPGTSPTPTLISCPGCIGVLSLVKVEDTGHLEMTCTVGHKFSLQSLLAAKEEELERGLWSVVALLEHVEMVNRFMLNQLDQAAAPAIQDRLKARIARIQVHKHQIRQIIEESEPPDLG